MNFIISHSNINLNNFIFINPVENKIKHNSIFYKLYYDNTFFLINNFMMKIQIKYDNNNNILSHKEINNLNKLEDFLFKKLINNKNKNKKLIYISNNLINNKVNIFKKNKSYLSYDDIRIKNFIIKINGIWEDDENIGFSYSLIDNSNHLL